MVLADIQQGRPNIQRGCSFLLLWTESTDQSLFSLIFGPSLQAGQLAERPTKLARDLWTMITQQGKGFSVALFPQPRGSRRWRGDISRQWRLNGGGCSCDECMGGSGRSDAAMEPNRVQGTFRSPSSALLSCGHYSSKREKGRDDSLGGFQCMAVSGRCFAGCGTHPEPKNPPISLQCSPSHGYYSPKGGRREETTD